MASSAALDLQPLTRRELQILVLIVMKYTTKQIADILYISPDTVGSHRKRIYPRIQCKDIGDVIMFVVHNDICDELDVRRARGTITMK